MKGSTYWRDCIEEIFDEAGITATKEQIAFVVEGVEGCHENYGLAHGYDAIPNPLLEENKKLKEDLKKEKAKVVCRTCNGYGRIIERFGTLESESECWECGGEGKK